MNSNVRTRLGVAMSLRWQGFRLLQRLSGRAGPTPTLPASLAHTATRESLWVFVSTIGELNAVGPFLRELLARVPDLQLVLLTDRTVYRAPYLAQYPKAHVIDIGVRNERARRLAEIRPPRLFVVAEIPCLPADAPCRLPFSYLYVAKRAGARIA